MTGPVEDSPTSVTVGELVGLLKALIDSGEVSPDATVLVSSDAEGNTLRALDNAMFWGVGAEGEDNWTTYAVEDAHEDGLVPALVLFPL